MKKDPNMSEWTKVPDGSYVGGSEWKKAPEGTYVHGTEWTQAPEGLTWEVVAGSWHWMELTWA